MYVLFDLATILFKDLTTSDLKRSVYIVCKIFREG